VGAKLEDIGFFTSGFRETIERRGVFRIFP
jgi:hypothetical protein